MGWENLAQAPMRVRTPHPLKGSCSFGAAQGAAVPVGLWAQGLSWPTVGHYEAQQLPRRALLLRLIHPSFHTDGRSMLESIFCPLGCPPYELGPRYGVLRVFANLFHAFNANSWWKTTGLLQQPILYKVLDYARLR